jgi:hypothetical protein
MLFEPFQALAGIGVLDLFLGLGRRLLGQGLVAGREKSEQADDGDERRGRPSGRMHGLPPRGMMKPKNIRFQRACQ